MEIFPPLILTVSVRVPQVPTRDFRGSVTSRSPRLLASQYRGGSLPPPVRGADIPALLDISPDLIRRRRARRGVPAPARLAPLSDIVGQL